MGRGSSGSGGGGARSGGGMVPRNPVNLTDEQAEELRAAYESDFDANTQKSIEKYISRDAIDGKGHSLSQTMNFLVSRGEDLETITAEEVNAKYDLSLTDSNIKAMRRTNRAIDGAMHDIGMDVNLERGAHSGQFEKMFGVSDYTTMSESQLKSALIGKAFKNTAVWSTSYNTSVNPFLSGSSSVAGGREVIYRIKAGSKTQCVFGAKSQAEIILGKGTNFKVTDVGFTGKTAKPRSSSGIGITEKPQIYINIETF